MKKITATLAIAAFAALSLTGCQNLVQNEPVTCKVIDKDRSTGPNRESIFRIYTEGYNCETFGLADNLVAGNWNAADMYAQIKVDKTYSFKTVGVRNGFFSSFKEIVKFEEVSPTVAKLSNGVTK